MNQPLILIANPGSASRKYALFEGHTKKAQLHFEWINDTIQYTLTSKNGIVHSDAPLTSLDNAAGIISSLFRTHHLLQEESIRYIGLRIVAPGSYFLRDHKVDKEFLARLHEAFNYAPLHIKSTLKEIEYLQDHFPGLPIYGISDSAFHATKPDHAWNYGISLELADKWEIKRFGYHGLSIGSAIKQLPSQDKVIVCHLGGGTSITGVKNGISVDTTMGYSPLEGLIMSTRSGSLDMTAAFRLKKELGLDDESFEMYLNTKSGLLGLGGSSDIRKLLQQEERDHRAYLALATFVYSIQKGIGQMAAALNGVDSLVFTGTIGERSAPIRQRVISQLSYLGLVLDQATNAATIAAESPTTIHADESRAIYVLPAQEEQELAAHVLTLASE